MQTSELFEAEELLQSLPRIQVDPKWKVSLAGRIKANETFNRKKKLALCSLLAACSIASFKAASAARYSPEIPSLYVRQKLIGGFSQKEKSQAEVLGARRKRMNALPKLWFLPAEDRVNSAEPLSQEEPFATNPILLAGFERNATTPLKDGSIEDFTEEVVLSAARNTIRVEYFLPEGSPIQKAVEQGRYSVRLNLTNAVDFDYRHYAIQPETLTGLQVLNWGSGDCSKELLGIPGRSDQSDLDPFPIVNIRGIPAYLIVRLWREPSATALGVDVTGKSPPKETDTKVILHISSARK